MAASWDSLCPDMKEQIFAPLSLLDLGRAAPTCQDFRAAYKARVSAAHPAAVEAGVSLFGEAFLRELSIQMLGQSRRVQLFARGGVDVDWWITPSVYDLLEHRKGFSWSHYYYGRLQDSFHRFPQMVPDCPTFTIHCVKQGPALRVTVRCDSAHCRQAAGAFAAGAFAAVCEYLQPEVGGSTPRRCAKPLKAVIFCSSLGAVLRTVLPAF
jgi:hypothetical protein